MKKPSVFVEKTMKFSKNLNTNLVKNFIIFDEVDSTNTKAKEFAENSEEGTIILSRIQKKGRGRFRRIWESPEGGLYLSIILKPLTSPDKTTLLPLMASIAVAKTINNFGLNSKIKWPNDVRINGKKISGILLESEIENDKIKHIILGIGINLNITRNMLSKDLQKNTTSMLEELGENIDYYVFLKMLLKNLSDYYNLFLNGKFEEIIEEWKQNSDTLGKKIIIKTPSGNMEGIAHDLDQSGFLIIHTEGNKYKKITSGDCIYLEEL